MKDFVLFCIHKIIQYFFKCLELHGFYLYLNIIGIKLTIS